MQLAIDFTAKDAGIKRVTENNTRWVDSVVLAIGSFAVMHDDFSSDDFRTQWKGEQPQHPNAWGAAFNAAARAGLIEKTGQYRPSRSAGAHARVVPVWRRKTH